MAQACTSAEAHVFAIRILKNLDPIGGPVSYISKSMLGRVSNAEPIKCHGFLLIKIAHCTVEKVFNYIRTYEKGKEKGNLSGSSLHCHLIKFQQLVIRATS